MRIAAITPGRTVPSARFRVRQHIAGLRDFGISVREFYPPIGEEILQLVKPRNVRVRQFPPAYPVYALLQAQAILSATMATLRTWGYDVTWLQRGLIPGWPTMEVALKRPMVIDVDDAVWQSRPFGDCQMKWAAERADAVVVCNAYLAEWFQAHCRRVELMPTTVDGERFVPLGVARDGPFVVGWTGTSGNFAYLFKIRDALEEFLGLAPDACLRFVADKDPRELLALPNDRVEFVKWSEENEVAAVQSMSVGLMPLEDDKWAHGKCSFKIIQYMACGVPFVVSPVGMNAEVLRCGSAGFAARGHAEWVEVLLHLYRERDVAKELGQKGRSIFLANYDRHLVTEKLAILFRSLS